MTKTMLVDATHPEETRVAIVDGNRLTDFDFERASRQQLKGNIYLAKVIRIEPSLQAAFVEYGGNRHGFLPFSEIHPDYFRIPMADRPQDEELDGDDSLQNTDESTSGAEDNVADYDEERADLAAAQIAPAPEFSTSTSQPLVVDGIVSSTEFSAPASDELGLITDFGNAAVDPLVAEAVQPIETIGGEGVEEEARERRQPRPRYKIQEVVKRRQVMLIQVVKEERGNKGAALTTFLSLAGRYCVLMPNSDGGGVSRKITSHQDRRRMKDILDQLEVPEGMGVILRTAGMEQEPAEIQRDLEYLLRLWNSIREETLQSTAPALIYEEANLIKRSLRDLYGNDLDSILVAGAKGYQLAVDFMRTIMPDSLDKVRSYEDSVPLFFRYNVEKQIDQLYTPVVQLRSGGYIVINPTEALVSIDVNSGRATRERHIEGTALKTNLEAAEEVARQLRLRDLAGLIVIDFIDMEDGRNNAAVERRLKDAMKSDRARLQIGRISPFGLLELSRQRMHPSLMEINFEKCPHCVGLGLIRSVDSAAISILRTIEEEAIKTTGGDMVVHVPTKVVLYILNQKRAALIDLERRYNLQILLHSDDALVSPDYKIERARVGSGHARGPAVDTAQVFAETHRAMPYIPAAESVDSFSEPSISTEGTQGGDRQQGGGFGRRRGGRGNGGNGGGFQRGGRGNGEQRYVNAAAVPHQPSAPANNEMQDNASSVASETNGNVGTAAAPREGGENPNDPQRRGGRRRGRRGGRGRHGGGGQPRDGQREFQPRDPQQHADMAGAAPVAVVAPSSAPVPMNIRDIDTTPRAVVPPRSSSSTPTSSSPYEIVSEASDKSKGGWWKRLTGQ